MSREIVVIMNRTARPKGLVSSSSNFCATANPVIEGFVSKKFRIRIAETMFAMNKEVFMVYSLT